MRSLRITLIGGGLLFALHSLQAMQAVAPAPAESSKPADDIRVRISVRDRTLWVIAGADTLRTVSVAVASGEVLEYGGRRWKFTAPEGKQVVRGKKIDPLWQPPDWHYAEVARSHGLQVKPMSPAGTALRDGRRLVLRDSLVGIVTPDDTAFAVLPVDEHIIFDSTLFIPPMASRNRLIAGELGKYALDLGDGYLLHGTRDLESIGTATTHGCIRIADDDLLWLFEHVPVGTIVQVH